MATHDFNPPLARQPGSRHRPGVRLTLALLTGAVAVAGVRLATGVTRIVAPERGAAPPVKQGPAQAAFGQRSFAGR